MEMDNISAEYMEMDNMDEDFSHLKETILSFKSLIIFFLLNHVT